MTSHEISDRATAAPVTLRYWAGARAAAGVETDQVAAGPLEEVLAEAVRRHPGLAGIAPLCSVLIDGLARDGATEVSPGAVVELLPPFAGG